MSLAGVPDAVRRKAIIAGAQAWLDGLPSLVGELERAWDMNVGRPYEGGTEAFVAAATLRDGSAAVLKLLIPREGDQAKNEITVLRLADGNGCARLLRSDIERHALLLERLGPTLAEAGLPLERRHEILCETVRPLWRQAPGSGLPTGAERGRGLQAFIIELWTQLNRPCSEKAVEYALACAERRIAAHDDERAVLVHGDVHQWNALKAGQGYKLIDPDGILAEAEYDLGVLMREDPVELSDGDPRSRARWLADRTGLDETAIWEWGAVERLSTGLLLINIEMDTLGRKMLEAAELAAISHE